MKNETMNEPTKYFKKLAKNQVPAVSFRGFVLSVGPGFGQRPCELCFSTFSPLVDG